MVSSTGVKLNVDCQLAGEKEIKSAGNTSRDGYQVLGKMSKSGGSAGESATVSTKHKQMQRQTNCVDEVATHLVSSAPQFQLQMFDIVCTLGWTSRDRCCDLPSMVRALPAAPHTHLHSHLVPQTHRRRFGRS